MTLMGSGIGTDIVTGKPVAESPDGKGEDALSRYHNAVNKSLALAADLKGQGGTVLQVVYEQMGRRLNELAQNDPQYLALLEVARIVGQTVNLIPGIARKHLQNYVPQFEPQAAADEPGIPA